MAQPHKWIPSRVGHGALQCEHCRATEREIAAIGDPNHCDAAPAALPADVVALVIAAREIMDIGGCGPSEEEKALTRALDQALEAFSSRVPYENEPDEAPAPPATPCYEKPLPPTDADPASRRRFAMEP